MNDLLVLEKLDVGYDKKLINNIDLVVDPGKVYALLSSNNCGKTTLIKTIAGIVKKLDGEIYFEGKRLTSKTKKKYILNIGYVPEDYNELFLCNKVIDELRYPLIHLAYNFKSIDRAVEETSQFLGLTKLLDKDISKLSNFNKLKLSIGSAIMHDPKILLLDDPFRELNKEEREELHKIIIGLSERANISVIYTTSDLNDVRDLDNIVVIGEKNVYTSGTYDEIIKDDNNLAKLGINIPIMVDLSRKLEFYNLIDTIYYDVDEVINKLWK